MLQAPHVIGRGGRNLAPIIRATGAQISFRQVRGSWHLTKATVSGDSGAVAQAVQLLQQLQERVQRQREKAEANRLLWMKQREDRVKQIQAWRRANPDSSGSATAGFGITDQQSFRAWKVRCTQVDLCAGGA